MTTNLYWHQTFLIRFSSSLLLYPPYHSHLFLPPLCILPTTPTSSSLHFVSVFPPFVSYLSSSFFPPPLPPPSSFFPLSYSHLLHSSSSLLPLSLSLLLPPPPFPSPSSSLFPPFPLPAPS